MMKGIIRKLFLIFVISCLVFCCSCNNKNDSKEIVDADYSFSLYIEDQSIFPQFRTQAVAFLYENGKEVKYDSITFSTANSKICTINEQGEILGIEEGSTSITAICSKNGKNYTASENISVENASIIKTAKKSMNLAIGEEPAIVKVGAFYNGESVDSGFEFISNDTNVVEIVEGNKLLAKNFGQTIVEISYMDLSTSISINVDTMNIYTESDFLKIGENLDKNFVLQNDITFTSEEKFGFGVDFKQGMIVSGFSGVLDGNGYCVTAGLEAIHLNSDFERHEAYYGVVFANNYGIIKNISFQLSTNCGWSGYKLIGLIGTNYGLVDNVLLYGHWGANSYWDIGGAGLVAKNIGDIQNCVVIHDLKNIDSNQTNAVNIVGAGYYKEEGGNSKIMNCYMLVLNGDGHSGNKKIENINDNLFVPTNCILATNLNEFFDLISFDLANGWSEIWDLTDSTFSFGNKIILNN